MPRATQTITLGVGTLEVTQLGARDGARVFAHLIRLLGPVLAPIVEALIKGERVDLKSLDIAGALDGLRMLDPEALVSLVDAFARATLLVHPMTGSNMGGTVKTPIDADDLFAGRYSDLIKWLGDSIAFNFRDFSGSGTSGQTSRNQAEKAPSEG